MRGFGDYPETSEVQQRDHNKDVKYNAKNKQAVARITKTPSDTDNELEKKEQGFFLFSFPVLATDESAEERKLHGWSYRAPATYALMKKVTTRTRVFTTGSKPKVTGGTPKLLPMLNWDEVDENFKAFDEYWQAPGMYDNVTGKPIPVGASADIFQATDEDDYQIAALEWHQLCADQTTDDSAYSTVVFDIYNKGQDENRNSSIATYWWNKFNEDNYCVLARLKKGSNADDLGYGFDLFNGDQSGASVRAQKSGIARTVTPLGRLMGVKKRGMGTLRWKPSTREDASTLAYDASDKGGKSCAGRAEADPHTFGKNKDGEYINPEHLHYQFLLYANPAYDAGVKVELKDETEPPDLPYRVMSHLVYNRGGSHVNRGITYPHLWFWRSSTAFSPHEPPPETPSTGIPIKPVTTDMRRRTGEGGLGIGRTTKRGIPLTDIEKAGEPGVYIPKPIPMSASEIAGEPGIYYPQTYKEWIDEILRKGEEEEKAFDDWYKKLGKDVPIVDGFYTGIPTATPFFKNSHSNLISIREPRSEMALGFRGIVGIGAPADLYDGQMGWSETPEDYYDKRLGSLPQVVAIDFIAKTYESSGLLFHDYTYKPGTCDTAGGSAPGMVYVSPVEKRHYMLDKANVSDVIWSYNDAIPFGWTKKANRDASFDNVDSAYFQTYDAGAGKLDIEVGFQDGGGARVGTFKVLGNITNTGTISGHWTRDAANTAIYPANATDDIWFPQNYGLKFGNTRAAPRFSIDYDPGTLSLDFSTATAGRFIKFITSNTGRLEFIDGSDNIFFGINSGQNRNAGATRNIGIGNYTLDATLNLNVDNCVAIGHGSMSNLWGGYSNVGVGSFTFFQMASGHDNTGSGNNAGYNCNGDNNIYDGAYSGMYATNQDNEWFVNSLNRANRAGDIGNSIVYGIQDVLTTNQHLIFNANALVRHQLDVEGYGAIGNGSPLDAEWTLTIDRDFIHTLAGNEIAAQLQVTGKIGGLHTDNAFGAYIHPEEMKLGAGVDDVIATLGLYEPKIELNTFAVPFAATCFIGDAPTEGSAGNYGLLDRSPLSRHNNELEVGNVFTGEGGLVLPQRTEVANYGILETDHTIFGDATAGGLNLVLTLPAVAARPGIIFEVKCVGLGGGSTCTLAGGGANIDGIANYVFAFVNDSIVVKSDGAAWWIMAKYP